MQKKEICLCKHTNTHGNIKFIEGDFYNYKETPPFKCIVYDKNGLSISFTNQIFKICFETGKNITRDKIINEILNNE